MPTSAVYVRPLGRRATKSMTVLVEASYIDGATNWLKHSEEKHVLTVVLPYSRMVGANTWCVSDVSTNSAGCALEHTLDTVILNSLSALSKS